VNRNRGICHDGTTVCKANDEFGGVWGPCEGYVLPKAGATQGPDTCKCFSKGLWAVKNFSPCILDYGNGTYSAVATWMDSGGKAHCPGLPDPLPQPPVSPEPGQPWSQNSLNVDCAGQFELCLTIKAGDAGNPKPSDCVIARSCVEVWYPKQDVTQSLPPLPAWTAQDTACATQLANGGGYLEMSVLGKSIECDAVDDGKGGARVFLRRSYCPLKCAKSPSLPECQACANGGSGEF